MNKTPKLTQWPNLTAEAASWIAQIETGDFSREDLEAFREWVTRSPSHYEAVRNMAEVSKEANILSDFKPSLTHAIRERGFFVTRISRARVIKLCLSSAVVLAVLTLGLFNTTHDSHRIDAQPYLIATQVGEMTERTLADGSVVSVNTNSQIEVNFDNYERRVRLLKGEAFFDIAHESDRPFIVSVGDKSVKAIGTAFSVRWTDGDLSVVVSEGKVSVAPILELDKISSLAETDAEHVGKVKSANYPLFLKAGQKLSVMDERDIVGSVEENPKIVAEYDSLQIKYELSWRSGVLDFSGKPLSSVLQDLHRYTDVRFEIVDPEISNVKYSGVVWTDQSTDKQVSDVLRAMGLKLELTDDNRILISK